MPETFNPYRQWLELSVGERPHSDYALLGLSDYEPDKGVINSAADRAIARVRSHRPGENAAAWSRLLDELNGAKKRLNDPVQKQQYDDQLRSGDGAAIKNESPAPGGPAPAASTADYRYPPGMSAPSAAAAVANSPERAVSNPAPLVETLAPHAAQPTPAAPGMQQPQPYNPAPAYGLQQPTMPVQTMQPGLGMPMGPTPMMMPGQMGMPGYAMPMASAGMPMAYAAPMTAMPMQAMPMMAMPMQAQPMGYGAMPLGYGPQSAPPPVPPPGMEPLSSYGAQTTATAVIDPMAPVVSAAVVDPMAPIDPMAAYGAAAGGVGLATAVPNGSLPVGTAIGAIPGEAPEEPGLKKLKAPTAAAVAHAQQREATSGGGLVWAGVCIGAVCLAIAVLAALNSGDSGEDSTELANNPPKRVIHKVPDRPAPQPRPARPERPEVVRPKPKPEERDAIGMKPAEPTPMPKPVEPMPTPMPEKPVDPPPMPKPPEPMPKPPEPQKPLPTKEQVAELAQQLSKTRLALSEGNMEDAKLTLAAAAKLPKLPEHEAMYERMAMLVDYNGQFWDAIDKALREIKAKSANELMVGSQVLLIVDVMPEEKKIILRIAGQNRTYSYHALPGGIAVAIADKWFNQSDPASKVMKGAYAAVNKAGNVEKAKAMWDEAIAAGVDIKALPAVIDDKYDGFEQDLEKAMAARTPK